MQYHELSAEQFVKPTEDYLRVMTTTPEVAVADVPANVLALLACYGEAKAVQAELLVTPELSLTGYTAADMFFKTHVREQSLRGLQELAAATADGPAMAVGLPLADRGVMYNCAAMLADGKVQGIVPKSYIPNYNEFYEKRWFTSGRNVQARTIQLNGEAVPFGTDLLFDVNGTKVGVEICEDAWAPKPPSIDGALQGAEVYVNLSASNELVGKVQFRRELVKHISAAAIMGYAYTSAGTGESTADVIYGGTQLIGDNGSLVAERRAHDQDNHSLVYDFERLELERDRLVNKTFGDQAAEAQASVQYRVIDIAVPQPNDQLLHRRIDATPYLPKTPEARDEKYTEMADGLAAAIAGKFSENSYNQKFVIGLSGGLDSTLTLLLAQRAARRLGLDPSVIETITMPAEASSERTQSNATKLATAIGTDHHIVPIKALNLEMLAAIGHDQTTQDVAFENVQARNRTSILFNSGNMVHGLVLGTGDMSEIAIGWCTYNGDHMSAFNPNASIPKTLIKDFVTWLAAEQLDTTAQAIVSDIVATPISPELTGNGGLEQESEAKTGPYVLNDFFDWHSDRLGDRPTKIGYLAKLAFAGSYEADTIARWLNNFLFKEVISQGKRDAMPNGTKIGSMDKSPRGSKRQAPNTSASWFL